jgi:hypothetical protein
MAMLSCVAVIVFGISVSACGSSTGSTGAASASTVSSDRPVGSEPGIAETGSASPADTGPSGEPFTIESDLPPAGETVVTVVLSSAPSMASPAASASSPSVLEIAHISVRCINGTYPYDRTTYQFVSTNQKTYLPELEDAAARFGPPLEHGTLTPGTQASGVLVFDVPPGGGQVELSDEFGPQMGWVTAPGA